MSVAFRWGNEVVDVEARDLPGLKASFLVRNTPSEGAVTEIGCGGGKMLRTLRLHRPALDLHGCDVRDSEVSDDAFTFAKLDPATSLLPYASASFDAVAVMDVLEHVPEPASTLDEIARILKPGGRLVAFVPVEGERFSAYTVFRTLLGRDIYARTKEHIQAFSHEDIDALLDARFEVEAREYAYHVLGQTMDATLYAATGIPAIGRLFWSENRYYVGAAKKPAGIASRVMNGALQTANLVAWAESRALARVRSLSAGTLFVARKRRA
ncbi:MAG: class I SAM-dependent methyltransferase [Polyangiaceae bacterium]|nr:class I SAM-dependent methyltransferase [Polyangiaceae bacterium]